MCRRVRSRYQDYHYRPQRLGKYNQHQNCGVNVFPSQIEEILFAIEGCEPHYQLVLDREEDMDVLEVRIEVTENIFFDEMKKQKSFVELVERKIHSVLGVGVTVRLVEPSSLPRHEGKAKRVIDNRKM